MTTIKTSPESIISLTKKYKTNPEIRSLAINIIKTKGIKATDYPEVIKAIADWVHNNIMFVRDPYKTDIMHTPIENLQLGYADCEDYTVTTASLLQSLGIPTKVVVVSKTGKLWDHVFLRAGYPPDNPRYWVPVDTTITPPAGREIMYKKQKIYGEYKNTGWGAPDEDSLSWGNKIGGTYIAINSGYLCPKNSIYEFMVLFKEGINLGKGDTITGDSQKQKIAINAFKNIYNGVIPSLSSSMIIWWKGSGRYLNIQIKANKAQYIDDIIAKLSKQLSISFEKWQPNLSSTYFRILAPTPSPIPSPTVIDKLWNFIKEHKFISLGTLGIIGLAIYLGVKK